MTMMPNVIRKSKEDFMGSLMTPPFEVVGLVCGCVYGWVETKYGLRDCYAHKNIIFPGAGYYDESYVTYSLEEIRRDEVTLTTTSTNEKRRQRRRSHSAIRYDTCNVLDFFNLVASDGLYYI